MNENVYILLNFDLQSLKIKMKSNQKLKFNTTYETEVKAIRINKDEYITH